MIRVKCLALQFNNPESTYYNYILEFKPGQLPDLEICPSKCVVAIWWLGQYQHCTTWYMSLHSQLYWSVHAKCILLVLKAEKNWAYSYTSKSRLSYIRCHSCDCPVCSCHFNWKLSYFIAYQRTEIDTRKIDQFF